MVEPMKLLIVGFKQAGHMGSYLASAARQLGLDYDIIDAGEAEASGRAAQAFYWHLRGKRPGRLGRFGSEVVDLCAKARYDLVLTTGRAPIERSHIESLRGLGATVINYSTDDPWNPRMQAPWFLRTLPFYDAIFTARRANRDDFIRCGAKAVHYLPFAYDAQVHRPWTEGESARAAGPSDILFVGGCDADRLPFMNALIDAGLDLALFGGYWNRHRKTRQHWRGFADQDMIRAASASARACLCLVRRANRDGNVMRTFEAAAIGGCILAEDTPDHRELFGQAATYFATPMDLVDAAQRLMANATARRLLANRLAERMAGGGHTYADRLAEMLRLTKGDQSSVRGQLTSHAVPGP
jgi:spore maturation protein CgeB